MDFAGGSIALPTRTRPLQTTDQPAQSTSKKNNFELATLGSSSFIVHDPYEIDPRAKPENAGKPRKKDIDLRFRPYFLDETYWRQLGAFYRRRWQEALFGKPIGMPKPQWFGFSDQERADYRERKFVYDLLEHYKDDLAAFPFIDWSDVILECDRDMWICYRKKDDNRSPSRRFPQRFEVTYAIFISGKDIHVNQSGFYWETRCKFYTLIAIYWERNKSTGDPDVDAYIKGYMSSLQSSQGNLHSHRWLRAWHEGRGDLGIDTPLPAAERPYRRFMNKIQDRIQDVALDLMGERLEDLSETRLAMRIQALSITTKFFRLP